jgi:choline-sulfatase
MTLNTLIIMSDEHNPAVTGCHGDPIVKTPNIDALAARGTRFANAYCNSPICVPSRASFQTGLYVHQIGYWDNAMPYDGAVEGWGHALQKAGRPVVSIGKLHFRRAGDPNGFDEEIAPIYVNGGVGDLSTLLRRDPPPRPGPAKMAADAGPGHSPYWQFDSGVAERAERWLEGPGRTDQGWTLYVSMVMPHFPLTAPPEFYALYEDIDFPSPLLRKHYVPDNRAIARMRELMNFDDYFDDDALHRALAGYYGIVSAMDHNVGRVLKAVERLGLNDTTRVVYTSDHGDNLGARGFWGKSTMWQGSVGIPMIMAGPDIAAGAVCDTPVSLVDLHPTIVEWSGVPDIDDGRERPGRSLSDIAAGKYADRSVFAEYHAVGAFTGTYMLRHGQWKLIEFTGDTPLLYDLDADPDETRNLAADPAHAGTLADMRQRLAAICDTDAVTARAFADQDAMVERVGGVAAILATAPINYTVPPVLGPAA